MLPHMLHGAPHYADAQRLDYTREALGQISRSSVSAQQTPPVTESSKSKRRKDTSESQSKRDGDARRKKAGRACLHCQKAHLTCDDSRPCQRCVKRGMAESCVEGVRKRAKYLLDEEELADIKRKKDEEAKFKQPTEAQSVEQPVGALNIFQNDHPFYNLPLNTTYQFGSDAANREYSILSAILGNPLDHPSTASTSSKGSPFSDSSWPQYASMNIPLVSPDGSTNGGGIPGVTPEFAPPSYPPPTLDPLATSFQATAAFPAPTRSGSSPSSSQHTSTVFTTAINTPPTAGTPTTAQPQDVAPPHSPEPSEAVYCNVTKPYDYREGFHFLMRHLKERFVKNDILRIIRALAIFRPSLIALTMPLSEEDEIFVEKCLQRSLIELEKLISFNGTPTVVWRRTGEICIVGVEFSVLTGWGKEELVGQHKFIYELFENQSAVEYWEKFASHAFENTTQYVHSHCVLLTRNGTPVLCAFSFSIRRDMFDLPNIVIGQWLPLLS